MSISDPSDDQRRHLGAFIRLHRERMQPEGVGVAPLGRRRTPGLRREELAQLCGVSSTWITWLEQGRPIAASAGVLARLAQVLQLSFAERVYLFNLAGRRDPAVPEPPDSKPSHSALSCVDAMQCPAYVLDQHWNVVAHNAQAAELFLHWGAKPQSGSPNLLRFLFLDPQSRCLIHDWDTRSWRLVAEFRADCARRVDTAPLRALLDELTSSSNDFARCWQTQDVLQREGGQRRFHHPKRGELVFEQLTLHPAVQSDLKIVMLLPVT